MWGNHPRARGLQVCGQYVCGFVTELIGASVTCPDLHNLSLRQGRTLKDTFKVFIFSHVVHFAE